MTNDDRTGALATAFWFAYMLTLLLLGVQAARWVGYVIYCVIEYWKGE